jgi:peptidoglycan-N-acetylglucosamine deacetylase
MDRRPAVTLSPRGRLALFAVAGVAFIAFVMGASSGASADSASGPVAYLRHLPPPQPSLASQQAKAFATVKTYTDYISKGTTAKNEVALTFDDGPSMYTPAFLKILHDTKTPATFFTIGEEYQTFGKSAQTAALGGYPIGNHTWNHPNMPGLDLAGQTSQINDTTAAMVRAGIPTPGLFRPPYGAYDASTVALMKQKKMIMVLWTIDSEDWTVPGADTIVQNVLGDISAGDIVLMHDGGGDRTQTLAALPRILAGLKQKGLKPVTVPQMLLDDPPPRDQPPPPNLGHG